MKKKVLFLGIIFLLAITSFYGWNILKDNQEKVIDIGKINNVKLTLKDNKITPASTINAILTLDKFKQFDHVYIIQNKNSIYIALSETMSFVSKKKQKVSESFSSTMNYSDDFDIEEIYIVSGPEILSGGANPEKYDHKKLVWSQKELYEK